MQGETTPASAMTEASSPVKTHPQHHTMVLFHHEPHRHQPRNVNLVHEKERANGGFNEEVAIWLTKSVGTMWTAYTFALIAIIGLFAILGVFTPIVALLVAWASQTLIQLVLLPVIMVGQNVLGRKAELQADEAFHTTISTYHDIEQIMQHLCAQDAELLRHAKMLEHLLEKNGIALEQLEAEVGKASHLEAYTEQLSTNVPAASASADGEKQNT
ncbi:MAG: hypothetical protein JOZ18_23840 [Chloroflexi bacterium]|nr:hypothetical protein [Chloroflexota bacterium]